MDTQPAPTLHSDAELALVKTGGRNPEAVQGKPSLSKPGPHFTDHFTYFTEISYEKTRNSYDPSEMPHPSYFPSVRPEVEVPPPTPTGENG